MKTILVAMHEVEAARRLMKPVVALAREHGAHLIGLHVVEAIQVYSDFAMMAPSQEWDALSSAQVERAEEIGRIFKEATDGEDFVAEWRYVKTDATTASDRVIETARAVDLVVMAQEKPVSEAGNRQVILERTIRKCGRPVLVLPFAGEFDSFGKTALLGWSPTREAARAAHDAMPLLAGGSVTILTAHGADEGAAALATAKEMALAYDRRGIKADIVERVGGDISIGDTLLNEAYERGCDLIVTGAFGHSKLYDFVIGAVTTRMLESMTAPVLFSS